MAQQLQVPVKNAAGGDEVKLVTVLRSWQEAGGAALFLHANGVYGYKDGTPVRDAKEFDIIASPHQREAALAWWRRAGMAMSREHYSAVDERLRRLAGDFVSGVTAEDTTRDAVLYYRRSESGEGELSGPFAWMDLFPERPDWWAQARMVSFLDYTYLRADEAERVEPPPTGPPAPADPPAPGDTGGDHGPPLPPPEPRPPAPTAPAAAGSKGDQPAGKAGKGK